MCQKEEILYKNISRHREQSRFMDPGGGSARCSRRGCRGGCERSEVASIQPSQHPPSRIPCSQVASVTLYASYFATRYPHAVE